MEWRGRKASFFLASSDPKIGQLHISFNRNFLQDRRKEEKNREMPAWRLFIF
jgi:hypothetical protein